MDRGPCRASRPSAAPRTVRARGQEKGRSPRQPARGCPVLPEPLHASPENRSRGRPGRTHSCLVLRHGTSMAQVVLITGCSSGIGRAVAQRLTASGYTVGATARRVESLDGVAATTRLPLDVTESGDVEAVVAATLQRHGHIDVLVNNAGYAVRGAIEEVREAAVP